MARVVINSTGSAIDNQIYAALQPQRLELFSETSYEFRAGDGRLVFKGDFEVVDGAFAGGVATSIEVRDSAGALVATMDQLSIDSDDFLALTTHDELNALLGASSFTGSSGADRVYLSGASGAWTVNAGGGDDVITGAVVGNNSLNGGDGDDQIIAFGAGSDTLNGGAGDDMLRAGLGGDKLIGGTGVDRVEFGFAEEGGLGAAAIRIQLSNTGVQTVRDGVTLQISGVENVTGTNFDDWIGGDDGANRLLGGGGDDRLLGGRGNDYLEGGAGADTLEGGRGDDIYKVDLQDTVRESAGQGNDTIVLEKVTPTYPYDQVYAYVLSSNVENIYAQTAYSGGGGPGDDVNYRFTGNESANVIGGGYGDDVLTGLGGDDTIHAGRGNDVIYGGDGKDTLVVQNFSHETLGQIDLETGSFRLLDLNFGVEYNSVFDSIENVVGGEGGDTIYGSSIANVISGGSGKDKIYGRGGDDVISGGAHADTLYGDAGNDVLDGGAYRDTLTGGLGADRLTGGADRDVFVYTAITDSQVTGAGRDVILDFSRVETDKIDLSAIDASTLATGDQAFSFIGTSAFTAGVAGQLRYDVGANGHLYLYGDVNGDRSADFSILVANTPELVSANFIL